MNYHALFHSETPIRTGLIGTGAFGNSFLFQLRTIPRIRPAAVCDLHIDTARRACLHAGWPEDALAACATGSQGQAAFEAGKIVLAEDASLITGLPLDVVVEATGMPDAGARHARSALENGIHVAMVTKETDCVVGPILSHMAAERGLVYSQAEGDQPGMLIGLISWVQTLGLEILCAGKSSESDVVYDVERGTISNRGGSLPVALDEMWPLWDMSGGKARQTVERRAEFLQPLLDTPVADLCEMAIVMNATGYGYDSPALQAPVVRLTELAEVWGSTREGGILESTGVIDVVNCLRRSDEVSFAGGVFAVFACEDEATWRFLRTKGHIVSRDVSRGAIFLPYHFLGMQTAHTVLSAVDLGLPTGALDPQPRVDVGAVAVEPLRAGQRLSMAEGHVIPGVRPELMPAQAVAQGNAIPYYMAAENRLAQDVSPGTTLTYGMIGPDVSSALWALRRQQDASMLPLSQNN